MANTLNEAHKNKDYKIIGFLESLSVADKIRLISFGFTEGSFIKIIRKSISKNTIQVALHTCALIIRSKDACKILVKEV